MNIVYLCADRGIPVLGDKGASVHVREFVTAIAALGHDVTLVCSNAGAGNPRPPVRLIELAPDARADAPDEHASRFRDSLDACDRTLRRELRKIAYDHALPDRVIAALEVVKVRPQVLYERYSLFHRAGRVVANALGIPHVLEINAPLVNEQERYRGLRQKELAERIESDVWRGADRVVAVSEAVRECAAMRGVATDRITVLHNGVDTTRFHANVDGRAVRDRFGLDGRPVIGFIGSLKPWHGLDFLLDAYASIRKRCRNAALLVVGEGPGLGDLQARVAKDHLEDSVILAGRVPHAEIPAYLGAMDLTVAPYVAEERFYFSPLKVVESLAAGRPVIAPRLGQLMKLLQDGTTGVLYRPGDVGGFVDGVVGLLADRSRLAIMGRRAALAARKDFGWLDTARRATTLMADARRPRMAM